MILDNFIVFEGIDGSGTSTQIEKLQEKTQNLPIWYTCEPTNLETGKFIRQFLKGEFTISPKTAAFLFAADRSEHIYGTNGIIEHIENKNLVMCDRYLFSSIAYQSPECGEALPTQLNSNFPLPKYLFYFDIDPATSLHRIINRKTTEIYEKLDFLQKVQIQYKKTLDTYKNSGMNIIIIDAHDSVEKITEKIWSIIGNLPIIKK